MKVRAHSLRSMEVNNLIAAGVIDGVSVRMEGVTFGTVGLTAEISIGEFDMVSGTYYGSVIFNPTAQSLSCGSGICHGPGLAGESATTYPGWSQYK